MFQCFVFSGIVWMVLVVTMATMHQFMEPGVGGVAGVSAHLAVGQALKEGQDIVITLSKFRSKYSHLSIF